jgi:hypothetical protein
VINARQPLNLVKVNARAMHPQTNLASIFRISPLGIELYKLATTALAEIILLALAMAILPNLV